MKARLTVIVKCILRQYSHSPDMQMLATEPVIKPAGLITEKLIIEK